VAARSKAWVYGRSIAGNAGSNPTGAWMSVSPVSVVRRHVKVSATGRSLVLGSPTECVCVSLIMIRCNNNTLHLQRISRKVRLRKKERKKGKKKKEILFYIHRSVNPSMIK
jgi:hypothetical protein